MALTRPPKYNIVDSNIALLGSDLEKRVREHAGDVEEQWNDAGLAPGLQIWRIEKFAVVDWPTERYGAFYDGDSYIVLYTYKRDPDAEVLSYDLHFWLGSETSQDEAGTAAYKTVELDDHLHGRAVQYREVEGFESPRFLSHFRQFTTMHGGVSTGFHHVTAAPPLDIHRLYRIGVMHDREHPTRATLLVREVCYAADSLAAGDVFVLDRGTEVWQFNTRASVGKEKFRAAEFVQALVNARQGACEATVFDEGTSGAGRFLAALGADVIPSQPTLPTADAGPVALFRLSDASGAPEQSEVMPVSRSSLTSDDVFLLDATAAEHPSVYVWIGRDASLRERRLATQYAQAHLHRRREAGDKVDVRAAVVVMSEGGEDASFFALLDA
ncbi:fragmin60 [Vararia minispora EC-137]|uniref:Fragmin60 n=1 Tax=Vararia minispora EC-137 TaxID=1314806 RepID=A0ACB8QDX5_9AGAM|nr:fragmin60 [Vararia minispora EC-137]